MLIILLIVIIITTISYFFIKYFNHHKLYLTKGTIKYQITNDNDKSLLKKFCTDSVLNKCKNCVFYTELPWSSKNNNYIILNDRYYIIDKDHYYYINDHEIVINKNIPVKVLDLNKYKSKITII